MNLYSYFRSTASYRVRIALHFKNLDFDYCPIHLAKGEQASEAFRWASSARAHNRLGQAQDLLVLGCLRRNTEQKSVIYQ